MIAPDAIDGVPIRRFPEAPRDVECEAPFRDPRRVQVPFSDGQAVLPVYHDE